MEGGPLFSGKAMLMKMPASNCPPTHLRTGCPTELGAAAGWEDGGLEGTWV